MGPLGDAIKVVQTTVGKVEKGVESAIDAVTAGVTKATSEGIASAKTTLETVVHKTDEAVKGVIDAAVSGLQKGPKAFFDETTRGVSKTVSETVKHLNDPKLNVADQLKNAGVKLEPGQEKLLKYQEEMTKFNEMNTFINNFLKQMHDFKNETIRNIRA